LYGRSTTLKTGTFSITTVVHLPEQHSTSALVHYLPHFDKIEEL